MLSRFERLMEQAVEGGVRRFLPTQLQPVQLAKAAERAMEDSRRIAPFGANVDNVYVIQLGPEDHERLAELGPGLRVELTHYLTEICTQRRFRTAGPIQVRLVEQRSVSTGTVRVETLTRVDLQLRDDLGQRIRLDPAAGRVRIGRAVDNDLVIDSQRVSRHHAELRWQRGWFVYDLDSTNGTFVDDEPVSEPRALHAGARLRLGDHVFVVSDGSG